MRTRNHKIQVGTLLAFSFFSMSSYVLAGDPPPANPSNPFEDGVKHAPLTDEERASLLEFANSSKVVLDNTLTEASDKGPEEAMSIYLDAIKPLVAASYQEHRRSELLMRFALNQAMELTAGIPTSDGSDIQTPGVLASSKNLDLINAILENSIRLAVKYYENDRQAIKSGSLIQLPYIVFAQEHLELGKTWLAGVLKSHESLVFEKAILNQWQTTVLQNDHLTERRISSTILRVDDEFKKISDSKITRMGIVRHLRGVIEQVLKDVHESGALGGSSKK